MGQHKVKFLAFASGLLLLGACTMTKPLYTWGHYENTVYDTYATPGKYPPEKAIIELEADLLKAGTSQQGMAPGFYAYLGYQYYKAGRTKDARGAFETEKKRFPESRVLMDRFIGKVK